ncbi:MAG: hypothetical protein FWF53_10825 [Candidatus Azobacteroides sp.]|nr:hypothetical protein [Candidatus Azobacteroides sp.]
MAFGNKIEQYLKEVRALEQFFLEAQSKEILPLSFFSSSIDILNRLKTGIYEIEAAQLQLMQKHLKNSENDRSEVNEIKESEEPIEWETRKEKPMPIPAPGILADTIGRKMNADFGKSLSLNDHFMFQRDLFQGDANEMNRAFSQLNAFQSLNEVLEFLDEKYDIPWNSDSGIVFKELLDKRFT